MKPIVPTSEIDIFFEGIFSEPRLRHPEGIAIDREGNVWCGHQTPLSYGAGRRCGLPHLDERGRLRTVGAHHEAQVLASRKGSSLARP